MGLHAGDADGVPDRDPADAEACRDPLRVEQHLPRRADRWAEALINDGTNLDGHLRWLVGGDTLVIDTKGFNGRTYLDVAAQHPSSDALHIVERLTYIDAQRVAYEITIEDPKIYTTPITNSRTWVRMKPGEELMEYWCMENNRSLLDGHLDHLKQEEAYKKYFGR
jgi:hypothetical protein